LCGLSSTLITAQRFAQVVPTGQARRKGASLINTTSQVHSLPLSRIMDRKNQRAAGAVPAVSALAGDDSQDEAVIWKKTLADLQRLSEVMEAGEAITVALDKAPEGRVRLIFTSGGKGGEKKPGIFGSRITQ